MVPLAAKRCEQVWGVVRSQEKLAEQRALEEELKTYTKDSRVESPGLVR